MKTIMAKNPHDYSFSFSRRYFNWRLIKKSVEEHDENDEEEEILSFNSSSHFSSDAAGFNKNEELSMKVPARPQPGKKSKLRSALTLFSRNNRETSCPTGLGTKVTVTLFGYRRGHVQFAFQEAAKVSPAFLIELATPTSVLVREMASGLVRIALECEKKPGKKAKKLIEEPVWRTYCNGRKCGYAMRRECGPEEWKVLKAVEPISMGAGVLPGGSGNGNGNGNGGAADGSEVGELMYMRARFERVVGSKDSEAFYMINPDGSGGPELSVYLLRA
uniref:Protein MIZU-KUSSEI 1 n=1 Tax=Rhizophora mucronata TaxID=61149 RepID=A0A2P2J036_RHIMU